MTNDGEAQSLGVLLRALMRERGLEGRLTAAAMPEIWAELVGPAAARVCRVLSCTHGMLRVEVRAAVWRAELQLRREELRQKLNERLGREFIREIVFK